MTTKRLTFVLIPALIASLALLTCKTAPEPEPQPEPEPEPVQIDLKAVAATDDLAAVAELLTDPAAKDENGNTALHTAAVSSSANAALLLLSLGADISTTNNAGETPLHLAAAAGASETVSVLLARGANIEVRDGRGDTPIHRAVRAGAVGVARMLSDAGASLLIANEMEERPLVLAVGDNEMLAALLPENRLDERDAQNDIALIAATRLRNPSLVRYLVMRGANTEAEDSDGHRALDLALGDPSSLELAGIAATLIGAGSVPRDPEFSYLVGPIRSGNPDDRDTEGNPPLVHAILLDHRAMVTWLLRDGAHGDVFGSDGLTPVHIAALEGDVSIVRELLGAGVPADIMSESSETVLHLADASVADSIVPIVLSYEFDLASKNEDGETVLHHAVESEWSQATIGRVLDAGADPNAGDIRGDMPLHIAVRNNQTTTATVLLERGASMLRANEAGETPLMIALNGPEELLDVFLDPRYIRLTDRDGNTMLHLAVQFGATASVIDRIIAAGASVNTQNNRGSSPFHLAMIHGRESYLDTLMEAGGDVFLRDATGQTPILIAATAQPGLFVDLMTTHGPSLLDSRGNTALHHLARFGPSGAVEVALSSGIGPDVRNDRRETPLHLAAASGNETTVQILLEAGANIDVQDQLGNTPLHRVRNVDDEDAAKVLLDAGAEIDARNAAGRTPLLEALITSDTASVLSLLEAGAHYGLADNQGNTPLHAAVLSGSLEKTNIIVSRSPDLSARNTDGSTPLHIAISEGYDQIARVLLTSGARLFARNSRNESPIDLILARGEESIAGLLQVGQVGTTDDAGNTILHLAIERGLSPQVVQTLLEIGADPDVRNGLGLSPLALAVRDRRPDVVRLLLLEQADIHVRDNAGVTPLIRSLAVEGDVLSWFVETGAIHQRDTEGNTALHLAVLHGDDEILSVLLDAGVDPESENLDGLRAIDLAEERDNQDAYSLLSGLE